MATITRSYILSAAIALAFAFAAAGCGRSDNGDLVTPSASASATPSARAATPAASEVQLPPDGQQLFDFLLASIPELVEKVPCSCCPNVIGQCYRGACPTTCGPCNKIGRDAYTWHKAGMSDDAIVAKVRTKYRIL